MADTTNITAAVTISMNAPAAKVWEALTNPVLIKQYLFGADVVSDWKVGSMITYSGVWEGKPYQDKGIILDIVPAKLLVTTYWSGLSGLPDSPENYKQVTYTLIETHGTTELTITQDNNATEEERTHSEKNWQLVLQGMKKLLEK